jgi:hypothetical protein
MAARLSWIYPCGPSPFVDALTYEKKLLYFLIDALLLQYIYVTVIFNIELFLNILFRYNKFLLMQVKIFL